MYLPVLDPRLTVLLHTVFNFYDDFLKYVFSLFLTDEFI